ncbi:MAG: MoxR family ATPase [Tepidiformaceae bacterium]
MFESIDEVLAQLGQQRYLLGRELATSVFLAGKLGKPLLVEGESGVGKSELAAAMSAALDTRLVRLDCHSEMSEADAVYEWNRVAQLLAMLGERRGSDASRRRAVFHETNLIPGPLLEALTADGEAAPVLLIDRVDLVDSAFEAFLVEFLDGFRVTIPEFGTITAEREPLVVLTSNRTRGLAEGLKRCCLYTFVGYPPFDAEFELLVARVPGISRALAGQICNVVARLRSGGGGEFTRRPGIGETLDWARALVALRCVELDGQVMDQTLGCLFKSADDIELARQGALAELLAPLFDRAG